MQQHSHKRHLSIVAMALVLLACLQFAITPSHAQTDSDRNSLRPSADEPNLRDRQSRVADRYDQLELLASRLAELSRATQPRRARLLRELVAKSRERDIAGRFDAVIQSLEGDNLGGAATGQKDLQDDLQKLLDLLLQEDRDKQIESERKRIRKYLGEVKRLIQLQRGIKARTDGGDDTDQLSQGQEKLAEATGKLGAEIEAKELSDSDKTDASAGDSKPTDGDGANDRKPSQEGKNTENSDGEPADSEKPQDDESTDGKPSEGKPNEGEPTEGKPTDDKSAQGKPTEGKPSEGESQDGESGSQGKPSESQQAPSQGQPSSGQPSDGDSQSSEQSQSPAERAQQKLKQAQQRMQQALEKLEEANREGAVDRQEQALRELEQAKAELERILRQLREEEMERMLVLLEARFRKMLDTQVEVYEQTKKIDESKSSAPEHEIEIASGRLSRQEQQIVREAERALVLLREDGTTVAFPEAIEQARDDMQAVAGRLIEAKIGIITQGLEEDIIAALEETLAALQQAIKQARQQKSQPSQPQQGEPGDQMLVDQLAELRMIRALQNRINRRTKFYGDMLGDEPAIERDLLDALEKLARRQERIFEATRDLDSGRNK